MNVVKEIQRINEAELSSDNKSSWHDVYQNSAYIFIGGLDYRMSEGDVMAIFSQYGEPTDINIAREPSTGKSKGFCFLAYEDQRSTVLAVDNFNGVELLGRTLRVDHCNDYESPELRLQKRKQKGLKVRDDAEDIVDAKSLLVAELEGHRTQRDRSPDEYDLVGSGEHKKKKKHKKEKKEKKERKHKKEKRSKRSHHDDQDRDPSSGSPAGKRASAAP